ncbi:MAG TPA: DUF2165 domain-containing protein [Thermomicrobiales bacterium]|nr:DUF2165 domain-containing protein [Thermomicrobiales bacterium]
MSSASIADRAWWERLGSLPFACGLLVFLNGLYLAFVAFGNITDYGTNEPFVQHVLSMDTTNFGAEPGTNLDDDVMWRAIENDTLHTIAYIGIIAAETLGAVILLWATFTWLRDGGNGYRQARALSTLGLLLFIAIFMGGFIAIGGEWFQMWKSDAWNGLDPAFRNSALALLTLVLIHLPSSHWTTGE